MIPLSILNLTLTTTAVSAASPQIYATNAVTSDACPVSSVPAAANHTGFTHNKGTEPRLRISNGGGRSSTILFTMPYFASAKHDVAGQYCAELCRDHSVIEHSRLPCYLRGCVVPSDIYTSLYRAL